MYIWYFTSLDRNGTSWIHSWKIYTDFNNKNQNQALQIKIRFSFYYGYNSMNLLFVDSNSAAMTTVNTDKNNTIYPVVQHYQIKNKTLLLWCSYILFFLFH